MSNVNNQSGNLQQLQQQYAAAQQQLAALQGGGATATGGAAATTAAPATAAKLDNKQPGTFGPFASSSGAQVMITRDAGGTLTVPANGTIQKVSAEGKTYRFGPDGKSITAFQQAESLTFKVNLDQSDGIAAGLGNLSRMFSARQERVKLLSNALADDGNEKGTFDAADVQKLSQETTTTQQLSEMQKKIFDSMRDSIQAWLR